MSSSAMGRNSDLALLLLRIGVGLIFIHAGWGKLTGIEGTQGFFLKLGIPMAGLMAWVVAVVEFFGGLMVLLGLYVRIPTPLLACVMVVAIFTVKLEQGWGPMRIDLTLLLMCLALFLMGSGRISLDQVLAQRGEEAKSGAGT